MTQHPPRKLHVSPLPEAGDTLEVNGVTLHFDGPKIRRPPHAIFAFLLGIFLGLALSALTGCADPVYALRAPHTGPPSGVQERETSAYGKDKEMSI